MFETIAIYSGLIATLWIFIGVYVASRFYEGYSHSKQFCSELVQREAQLKNCHR